MSHSLWTERDTNLVLVMPRISRLSQYQDTSNNNVQWVPAQIVAIDPVRDLAVLEIDGQIEIRRGGVEGSDQVEPGARIPTLGFPHSSDAGRFVLTQQDTTVGARVLISSNGVASKHLVLNVQTRPGRREVLSSHMRLEASLRWSWDRLLQAGQVVSLLEGSTRRRCIKQLMQYLLST